jgi:intein-encoded DNA endonuclease-like protein
MKKTAQEYRKIKEEVIKLFKEGLKLYEIGKITNVAYPTVSRYLKKEGFKINPNGAYNLNVDKFKEIKTEEDAYWLGFIMADGNVCEDCNSIEISLKLSDFQHLEKLKNYFEWGGIIRTDSFRCRLTVTNENIKNNLVSKGCTPRKSLTLKFPTEEQVPNELISHFIRGYFDGDGYISDPMKGPISISLLGTKEFLESIVEKLELKGKSSILKKDERHLNNTFHISMFGQDARNLISYIYKDSTVFLERKHDRYVNHIERVNKNVKWRSNKTIYSI